MFCNRKGQSVGPIGCCLDDGMLRLVQLCTQRDSTVVVTKAIQAIGPESKGSAWQEVVGEALKKAWRDASFIGRKVVCSLPVSQVSYHRIRLPSIPDSELDSVVHWRVAKEMNRAPDEISTAHHSVGEVSGASKVYREILAVAAGLTDVRSIIEICRNNGMTVAAIDTRASALGRCLREPVRGNPLRVVVDIHADVTTLIALNGVEPCFVSDIPHGLTHLSAYCSDDDSISRLSEAQAAYVREIAQGLHQCLQYLSEFGIGDIEQPIGGVLGAHQATHWINRALQEQSGVEFLAPTSYWGQAMHTVAEQLDMALMVDNWLAPLGLALYGIEDGWGRVAA